jgi:alcohol dehydrogenase (cytochrome c)
MRPLALLLALAAAPLAAQLTDADIVQGSAANWVTYSGDYASWRHSPLDRIDTTNVHRLVPAWVRNLPGARRLETTPLVYDGVMYATNTNSVYAIDARNGKIVWQFEDPTKVRQRQNKGVALLGDRVFLTTVDCRLLALNRFNGAVIWETRFADHDTEHYTTSIAPLAVKGRILVGVAGGGHGQRGFVAAIDAETGKEDWRFWTVPAEGEPGSETWGGFPSKWAGAPTWTTGSYDPELNLLYWPTGNPWPDFYGGRRKGDNLYSDSVVALDADTGKMQWYFQFTPFDEWDWDANEAPVLIDREFRGKQRKLLIQANRNGFYYGLDRETGEFLHGRPFINELNWASGLDEKTGRPLEIPGMRPTAGGNRICPSVRGASNWMSPSYNPDTGLFYVVTLEQCDIYTHSAKEPVPNSGFRGTGGEQIPAEPGAFFLRALEPATGDLVWEYPMPGPAQMWAGTVSTAGGLIFSGDDDGNLVAFDAKTGKDLWHFSMGETLYASPMTYEVAGKQYVAIATASDIFTFALFEE